MVKALVRRGYELEGLFFGRPIRPFHLAVMISTTVIAYNFIIRLNNFDTPYWFNSASISVLLFGLIAFTASAFLFIGWWFQREWFAEWGLLLATGIWLTRMIYVVVFNDTGTTIGSWSSAFLSLAWSVGAGGAYLLERYDHVTRDRDE